MRASLLLPLLGLLAMAPAGAATIIRADVPASDIDADLAAADRGCAAMADMVQKTYCFNLRERAVWLKDSPESIASFDLFAARRMQLISQVAAGVISWGEYDRGFRAASRRLVIYKTMTGPR